MTSYPTIRFVFDRKKQATKDKTALVQLEVLYNRQRKYFSTGIKLYADQWKNGKVIRGLNMIDLNQTLEAQYNRVQSWLHKLVVDGEQFSFDKLERFMAAKDVPDNFIEYVAEKISTRADIRESTRKTQRKLIAALKEFNGIVYFADLTKVNILGFDNWLHQRNYTQPTVQSYHKTLKTYIRFALTEELIEHNPYDGVKIDRGKSQTRKYLTETELNKLVNAEITLKTLERVRDLFLFQCYTGMAYAELSKFDFTQVVERDGKFIISDKRQKTSEGFYVVLLSPAIAILRKYDFVLPVISNQQYNLRLKIVAEKAGINIALSSHMARHTFAVWCLNNGCQIENLAKMMGHTNIATTQIYAKVLNQSVEKEFDRLEDLLKRE